MKRFRKLKAKPGELTAGYGRDEYGYVDLGFAWGEGIDSADASLLQWTFTRSYKSELDGETEPGLLTQLRQRGYDLTTLKFSIQKKDHA